MTNERISFFDYIKHTPLLTGKEKDLIAKRINGYTFLQIMKEENVTREAIRIREKNTLEKIKGDLSNFDFLDEDYIYIITHANFDFAFNEYEKAKNKVFISAKYYISNFHHEKMLDSHNRLNIIDALSDHIDVVPKELVEDIKIFYSPVIFDNGKVFSSYNGNAFIEILKIEGPKTKKELMDAYYNQNHVVYNPLFCENKKNNRYFESVIPINLRIIRTENKKLRFYDIDKYENEITNLLSNIKFPLDEGKFDMQDIYIANKALFNKAGVTNKYEAHSVLRHHQGSLPINVCLGRIPIIIIHKD